MRTCFVLLLLATVAGMLAAQPVALTPEGNPRGSKLWGNNVQVTNSSVYAFDADYRDNGEIYVGFICSEASRETLMILKSSDGGLNWSVFRAFLSNEDRKFTAISLVCGDTALLAFMPQDTAQGTMRDYAGRFMYSGGNNWTNFTDTLLQPRGIVFDVDADRSAGGDTVMIAYTADSVGINTGTAIRRSINGGASWLSRISNRSARNASIAWIKDHWWAMAYKCYWTDPYYYKHTLVSVSNDDGINFQSVRVDSTARDTLNSDPSITACRATGLAQVAVTYDNPSTHGDIVVYRALDAGDTTYRLVLDFAPGDEQLLPAVNCLRFDSGSWVDLAYADDYSDCIGRLTSQYGDSGTWGGAWLVSDRTASMTIAPKIAYCNDGSHPGPAVFYCGQGQNGIYMNAGWVTGVSGQPEAQMSGPKLRLEPSRPNPFKQWTMVNYQLPGPGRVNLKVFNSTGQLVRILIDDRQAVGVHSVHWDGRDDRGRKVSSGVYLVRLEANGQAATGKMLVVR